MPFFRSKPVNSNRANADSNAVVLCLNKFIPDLKVMIDKLVQSHNGSEDTVKTLLGISRGIRYALISTSSHSSVEDLTMLPESEGVASAAKTIRQAVKEASKIQDDEMRSQVTGELLGVALYAEDKCIALLIR